MKRNQIFNKGKVFLVHSRDAVNYKKPDNGIILLLLLKTCWKYQEVSTNVKKVIKLMVLMLI